MDTVKTVLLWIHGKTEAVADWVLRALADLPYTDGILLVAAVVIFFLVR